MKRAMTILAMAFTIVLLSAAFQASPALAQDGSELRQLEAEIIVFRRSGDTGANEESWTRNPGYAEQLDSALELGSSAALDADISPASPARLAHVVQQLNSSNDYTVLRHERIRLPERPSTEAPSIRFHLDQRPEPDETGTDRASERPSRFQDAHLDQEESLEKASSLEEEIADTRTTDLARPLDGTITIFRDRFFHVAADLIFNPDLDGSESSDQPESARQRHALLRDLMDGADDWQQLYQSDELEPFVGYRLNERRRIRRLGEIHYLDHPRFGVIVMLSRPD